MSFLNSFTSTKACTHNVYSVMKRSIHIYYNKKRTGDKILSRFFVNKKRVTREIVATIKQKWTTVSFYSVFSCV